MSFSIEIPLPNSGAELGVPHRERLKHGGSIAAIGTIGFVQSDAVLEGDIVVDYEVPLLLRQHLILPHADEHRLLVRIRISADIGESEALNQVDGIW